jgi:hypothetical protein
VSYVYNGLGDRLGQTVDGITTSFSLDLNSGLTQILNDGTRDYIYGLGRIAQSQGGTTEYFLGDAIGSARQLTDQDGTVTYTRAFDPFGTSTFANGPSQTPYGFAGEYTSNDLVYLRSRYYAPENRPILNPGSFRRESRISRLVQRLLLCLQQPGPLYGSNAADCVDPITACELYRRRVRPACFRHWTSGVLLHHNGGKFRA